MPHRQAIALGCALILGAAIAFPAGLLLGSSGGERERGSASRSGGPFREVYSPSIYKDRYFLEQQRRNVEALEQAGWAVVRTSAKTGENVEEAFNELTRRMVP